MKPPAGKAYVGCPDCGFVTTVALLETDTARPWCLHDGQWTWRSPNLLTQVDPATAWTRMVRCTVEPDAGITVTMVRPQPVAAPFGAGLQVGYVEGYRDGAAGRRPR